MSEKYKIRDITKPYFITMTVVGWVDVFTRKNQKLSIIKSLDFCAKNKQLTIFGYVIMTNHIHMICRADGQIPLTDILRDFKTFTSKNIIKLILEEPESRREWMLGIFSDACKHLKRQQNYKVWQNGNHAEEIFSTSFFYQKLNYVHNNPVADLIVDRPEDYLFSSARNYAELDNYLDVVVAGSEPLIKNWR